MSEHASIFKLHLFFVSAFMLKKSALAQQNRVTLLLIWSCFTDAFIWHVWNLSGTVASLVPFPSCVKFRARPAEPCWDPPLRAGTVRSDHTSQTEWALGTNVLCEYAQRHHNPLSGIHHCHCCKRETDVLHCRFTDHFWSYF